MPEPTGRSLRFAAYAATAVLLVTGCSEKPVKPGTVPTTAASPSRPSESPSALTPEQEVEAAVRAYYAELTRAARTNDTSRLKTMVSTGCPCYRAVEVINRNARQGERTPDASFELVMLRIHNVERNSALAEVRTQEAAYAVLDEDGVVVDRVDAQKTHLDLSLVKSADGRWIIGNWVNLGG